MATPDFVLVDKFGTATPLTTAGPTGMTPSQIRAAYGFNQLSLDGAGTTIAIVGHRLRRSDHRQRPAGQFDAKFNLPDPTSSAKVSQTGSTTNLPDRRTPAGPTKIALDVEWPTSSLAGDLKDPARRGQNERVVRQLWPIAVQYAAKQPGVVAVASMSFGGSEFNGETSFDQRLPERRPATPASPSPRLVRRQRGVPISYPAASPYVLSRRRHHSQRQQQRHDQSSETAWSGSGRRHQLLSRSEPSYQKSLVCAATGRDNPDVSLRRRSEHFGFPSTTQLLERHRHSVGPVRRHQLRRSAMGRPLSRAHRRGPASTPASRRSDGPSQTLPR